VSTDWGEALKIAGEGFGITVLILIILALVTWLVGLASQRAAKGEKEGDKEKGGT
jgi:Na+-transporting methylmalonyl-CoA/oxaloacetate decarboxylase gamma subunit